MGRSAIAPPPNDLSAASRKLWADVHHGWELDMIARQLLATALRAFDRAAAARALVAREGLVVKGTRGPRPHPAVSIEHAATEIALKAWRQLNLDVPPPGPMGRPPGRGPA